MRELNDDDPIEINIPESEGICTVEILWCTKDKMKTKMAVAPILVFPWMNGNTMMHKK